MIKKKSIFNSPRLSGLKKRRRKVLLNKILLLGLLTIIILGSLTYVSRLPRLNITAVEVTGNKVIETSVIETIVNNKLGEKYLWLIPKTNIFLYPKQKIKNELSNEFGRLENIDINLGQGRILSAAVLERTGLYTWCGNTMLSEIEKCYFLDGQGYVFDEAPYFLGEVYFKFYGEVGEDGYLFPQDFTKLIALKEHIENINLNPVGLEKNKEGDVKIFLSKRSGQDKNIEVILKLDSDFEKIAQNLKTAISTEPLKTKLNEEYFTLEYIDLRFGNKVYFK